MLYREQRPTMTLAIGESSGIHLRLPDGERPISSNSSSKELRRLSAHLNAPSFTSPSNTFRVLLIIAISTTSPRLPNFPSPMRQPLGFRPLKVPPTEARPKSFSAKRSIGNRFLGLPTSRGVSDSCTGIWRRRRSRGTFNRKKRVGERGMAPGSDAKHGRAKQSSSIAVPASG